jgi:microcompartment protein CcmK/EutM
MVVDLTSQCPSTLPAGESCTVDVHRRLGEPPGQMSGGIDVVGGGIDVTVTLAVGSMAFSSFPLKAWPVST